MSEDLSAVVVEELQLYPFCVRDSIICHYANSGNRWWSSASLQQHSPWRKLAGSPSCSQAPIPWREIPPSALVRPSWGLHIRGGLECLWILCILDFSIFLSSSDP